MQLQKIYEELNISNQCKKYRLPIWKCPHFLFVMMGLIIMIIVLVVYYVGVNYVEDPLAIALALLFLTAVMFILTFIITQNFQTVAEANQLKTEFVNIVSHQLRSPLTSLSWTVEALISGKFGEIDARQLEYFEILKENNERMKELVQDLITVSKIEDKSSIFKKENVSLGEIIKDLIFKFQPITQAKNIEIKFETKEPVPEILADSHQITTILENLINNAINYTPASKANGGSKGVINIYLSKEGKNINFKIKDNGVGIPKEDQKFIFQKFFRSQNAKETQPYGSGLGLFITKSIIDRSGGKIDFESEKGKGTTFWFFLPTK